MSRSAVRVLVIILVVFVLIVGGGGALAWWKISALKQNLLADLGHAIGARVEVASISINVVKGELHAAGISLTNQNADAPWDKGEISQATLGFHLSDVFSPQLPVTVEISSWSVVFHARSGTSESSFTNALPSAPSDSVPDSSKSRIQVTQLTAHDGTVEIDLAPNRKVFVHGVNFQASNNGANVWTTQLQATSLVAGSFNAGTTSVRIVGEDKKVSISDLRVQCDPGSVNGEGNVALDGTHEAEVNLKAVNVPVSMLVAVEWQLKLSGLVSGDLHYTGNDEGSDAKGQLSVDHGKLNVLPGLGQLTTMVGMQDVTDVEVDKETTDYEWKDHTLHLSNLDVRKNDVTRLAGEVDIDAQGQVDGHIKLGLPSTITAKWPQMQAQVFPVQFEDYNWAEVHLTGTPDHLQEDLTPRLVSVGLGQGSDLLNQAAKKATDLFNNFMGK
jgi:hypothetical protein